MLCISSWQWKNKFNIHRYILTDFRATGGGGTGVGGDVHKVDLAGNVNIAHHVRKENHNAFQNTYEDGILAGILLADLCCQFLNLGLNLLFGQQYFFHVISHKVSFLPLSLFFSVNAEALQVFNPDLITGMGIEVQALFIEIHTHIA